MQAKAAEIPYHDANLCCVGCFRRMPTSLNSSSEGLDDRTDTELLCASCILVLGSKSPLMRSDGRILSPLPKMSRLVQAETKCKNQIQLLHSQQESLRQQRESLDATRRAKEEALIAERKLARQRQKEFLLIQERKREEAMKIQMEKRLESDEKLTKKRSKLPKVKNSGINGYSLMESHLVRPASKRINYPVSCTLSRLNTTSLTGYSVDERRKQMTACYAQNLSLLLDGHKKPTNALFSKPGTASSMAKRWQSPSKRALMTKVVNSSKNQQGRTKSTQLYSFETQERCSQAIPPQQQQFNAKRNNKARFVSPLSLTPTPRLVHTAPLTPEIKPVPWAYELAKDMLRQDYNGITEEDADGPHFIMLPLWQNLP